MSRPAHADVLTAEELKLWRAVRHARQNVSGLRRPALEVVARRFSIDVDELDQRIVDIKAKLVATGAVPAVRFFAVPSSDGSSYFLQHAQDGSARCASITGTAGVFEFPSERFAYNATVALNVIVTLDDADRVVLADAFDALVDRCADLDVPPDGADATGRLLETVCLPSGRSASVLGHVTSCGFWVQDAFERPWTGSPAHARFIARSLRAGELEPFTPLPT